jgi:hypothetical protein
MPFNTPLFLYGFLPVTLAVWNGGLTVVSPPHELYNHGIGPGSCATESGIKGVSWTESQASAKRFVVGRCVTGILGGTHAHVFPAWKLAGIWRWIPPCPCPGRMHTHQADCMT